MPRRKGIRIDHDKDKEIVKRKGKRKGATRSWLEPLKRLLNARAYKNFITWWKKLVGQYGVAKREFKKLYRKVQYLENILLTSKDARKLKSVRKRWMELKTKLKIYQTIIEEYELIKSELQRAISDFDNTMINAIAREVVKDIVKYNEVLFGIRKLTTKNLKWYWFKSTPFHELLLYALKNQIIRAYIIIELKEEEFYVRRQGRRLGTKTRYITVNRIDFSSPQDAIKFLKELKNRGEGFVYENAGEFKHYFDEGKVLDWDVKFEILPHRYARGG